MEVENSNHYLIQKSNVDLISVDLSGSQVTICGNFVRFSSNTKRDALSVKQFVEVMKC